MVAASAAASGCIPPGKSSGSEHSGAAKVAASAPFEDRFTRSELGPDWAPVREGVWRVENGRLCGENARNQGVWLTKPLPTNARIEFDAVSYSPEGDLKAELWGDGTTGANAVSYTNATSYLTIFGGWKNSLHVLARLNEHGADRKEVRIDNASEDVRQHGVTPGQTYRFKVERADGKTVRWSVNGVELLSFVDDAPLTGAKHNRFGFNDWAAKVCFSNVRVTPL